MAVVAPTHIIFLVIPVASKPEFISYIHDNVVPISRDSVRILTDESAGRFTTDQKKQVAGDIASELSAFEPNKNHVILMHRDAKCDDQELKKRWVAQGNDGGKFSKMSPKNILTELRKYLQGACSFWRDYANLQIANFDGNKTSLDIWLQQFGELGFTSIGRRIVMQLRVIRPGSQIFDAFAPRVEEQLGLKQFHCFVRDDDRGGSWVSIQDALSHGHRPDSVNEVIWDSETEKLILPNVDAHELVVCEDGLWSGKETVRRLKALNEAPPDYLLRLRFSIVSDFGLLVARHAIRELGMQGRVFIDSSRSELMTFLQDNISDEIKFGEGLSIDEYYDRLHEYTLPHAFRNINDWPTVDQEICRIIGSQLVTQWHKRNRGSDPPSDLIRKFELGGGRFASTTLFSRSIPKVCLPLLWLDGAVELDGKLVTWKPLFIDSRRVGDPSLLYK